MRILKKLFDSNRKWAAKMKESDPDFFIKLSRQQTPDYLFIGSSEIRVPSNQMEVRYKLSVHGWTYSIEDCILKSSISA